MHKRMSRRKLGIAATIVGTTAALLYMFGCNADGGFSQARLDEAIAANQPAITEVATGITVDAITSDEKDFEDKFQDAVGSNAKGLGDVAAGLSVFLPPPWNVLGAALIPAAIGAWTTRRERKQAINIVKAIESVKGPDGTVVFNENNKKLLDASMGPSGKKIVDAAQSQIRKQQEAKLKKASSGPGNTGI